MNNRFLRFALEFSKKIDEDKQFRHVSIILRKNKIVSVGINQKKTHPEANKIGYIFAGRHSELDALIRVPKDQRKDLTLLNYRFNKQGQLRLSKPCLKCMPWCLDIFDEIYYSTNKGMEKLC